MDYRKGRELKSERLMEPKFASFVHRPCYEVECILRTVERYDRNCVLDHICGCFSGGKLERENLQVGIPEGGWWDGLVRARRTVGMERRSDTLMSDLGS